MQAQNFVAELSNGFCFLWICDMVSEFTIKTDLRSAILVLLQNIAYMRSNFQDAFVV